MNNDGDTIACIMCNGVVAYENRDKTKFFKHLRHDHSIFFNKLFIMAVNCFGEKTRGQIANQFENTNDEKVENVYNLMEEEIDIYNFANLFSTQLYQDSYISENVNQIEEKNKNAMNNKEDISTSKAQISDLDDLLKIVAPTQPKLEKETFQLSPSKVNLGKLISTEKTKEMYDSNKLEIPKKNDILNTSIPGEIKFPPKEQSTIEHYDKILEEPFIKTNKTENIVSFLKQNNKRERGHKELCKLEKDTFVLSSSKDILKKLINIKVTKETSDSKCLMTQNMEISNISIPEKRKIPDEKQPTVEHYDSSIYHKKILLDEKLAKTNLNKDNSKIDEKSFDIRHKIKSEKSHVESSNSLINIKSAHGKIDTDRYRKEPYLCDICQFSSVEHRKVWYHKQTHTANFLCEICEKSFASKGNLKTHMNIHTQEKLYQCSFCGKSFNFKVDFQKHEYIHGKIRPYKCELCEKGFLEKRRLNAHILGFHKGVKPFICETCGTCFASKYLLKLHEKVKH